MPQINYTKEGGSILYDWHDWLSGVDFTGNVIDEGILGNSLARSLQMDPLRNMGYLSMGKKAVDVTGVAQIDNYIRNGVVNNQSALMVSNGAKLQKATNLSSTPAITNDGTFPHTISDGHATPIGDDCTTYYVSATQYWFYSFNDATDWNVGRYDLTTTFDDDYMSTIPTNPLGSPYLTGGKGFPHPLQVADDDILYMGDRNFVHAYDGQSNTFFAAVLTLPFGFIITSFAKTNDRKLAIGGYYTGPSGNTQPNLYEGKALVWIWNLLDLDPDFSYDLHDNYVSEIRNWNGELIAFTSGAGTLTFPAPSKLQILRGGNFVPLVQFANGIPIRGGVDVSQDEIYWSSVGVDSVASINSYTKNPYTGDYIYNYLTTGSGISAGMLKIFYGDSSPRLFVSSGATTTGGLQTFTSGITSSTTVYLKTAYPSFPILKRGTLTNVTINFMTAVADGLPLTIQTLLDKSDQRSICAPITDVSNLKQIVIQTDKDQLPLGNFTSLQPRIFWSQLAGVKTDAAVIESIKYDFDYINI